MSIVCVFKASRIPIQLIRRIKSMLCYEEEGPVSYKWDATLIY